MTETTPSQSFEKPLVIRDEIHGDVPFDNVTRHFIDHALFQRLRRIKQLGLAEYVFPCATHTRFQHSLGAAYLAGKYLDSMVNGWQTSPFRYEGVCGKTRFHSVRTLVCIESVVDHPPSHAFWRRLLTLSGLLHDIGHGPWSHTFEGMALPQDFTESLKNLKGTIGAYFKEQITRKPRLMHEDISVLYLEKMTRDLATDGVLPDQELYFLPLALLINRKMASSPFQGQLEKELGELLKKAQIRGGIDFFHLLQPMISGPFDADRIDYIQRDGRNCGVFIAGIEWRRIVNKLLPCLAEHDGNKGEPREVVLVSNIKNQHVIDDFVFTLFQMYAQVYLHPKIVGLEEVIREILLRSGDAKNKYIVTLDKHQSFTDENFREFLKTDLGLENVEEYLLRQKGTDFEVARYPADSGMDDDLKKRGFSLVENLDRPLMKDALGVFLYSSVGNGEIEESFVRPWTDVSPLARQFFTLNYTPNIWIRSPFKKS